MKIKTISACAITATCLLPVSSVQAEVIYANGFDAMSLGQADDTAIKNAWSSRYAKGPDEGRVSIVMDSNSGNAGRVKYPNGGNTSGPSGATWETDIQFSGEDIYMSYWVKFDDDFQFVKGGKLPGLAGSTSFPYGDFGFTTRLMWREEGKLEFYLHGYNINNSQGSEPYRVFWDDAGEHARVTKGQWHHIEIRQKLNTPGMRDGRLQGWLDGELVCDDTDNSGTRASGQSSTMINHLYFSTFFGGSSAPVSQWQPTQDVYANFDDFTVSTSPIGMGGFPGDVSGGGSTGGGSTGDGSSGGGSTGGGSTDVSCIEIDTGVNKHEIDISSSSCIEWSSDLSGKTLAVWDSDTNSSCDFRGTISSANGSGSMTVPDNYEATGNLTGTQINIAPTNGCQFLKIRAM